MIHSNDEYDVRNVHWCTISTRYIFLVIFITAFSVFECSFSSHNENNDESKRKHKMGVGVYLLRSAGVHRRRKPNYYRVSCKKTCTRINDPSHYCPFEISEYKVLCTVHARLCASTKINVIQRIGLGDVIKTRRGNE